MSGKSLGAMFSDAMAQFRQMRVDGVDDVDCFGALETWLRAHYPQRREWRYLCVSCQDTGWALQICPLQACERTVPHAAHEYVLPCVCGLGTAHQARPKSEQDFTQAAKAPKRPTRFGR